MTTALAERTESDRESIFAEQIRLVYELGIGGAAAVIAVSWLYVMMAWPAVPRRELLLWVAVITLVSVVRVALAVIRRRHGIDTHTREWAWGLMAAAGATGLLWAYAGTALFPPPSQPQMRLITVFILVGMPAGAIASFGPYAKSYACYLIGAILPFAMVQYLRGGELAGWLFLASLVFILYLIRLALWSEKTMRDNIAQRLQLQRMAQGLAQARDAAESADRAKSDFLANMSHEVRTPLHAVIGMHEQLLLSPLDAGQREHLQTAQEASYSLLDTLESVLDMSRIEAGQLELHEERFDPHAVVERIHRLYRPVARRKQLDFSVAVSPAAPHALLGDAVRWRQVLGILVDNALKFTERGSVSVVIDARVDRALGVCAVRAEVIDTGIGISPDERYRLFKQFTQFDASSTGRRGGTGAGLRLAADLAKLMGGDVGVNSEKGKGSRFWFNTRLKMAPETGA
jgi:signal transduction histidine kinase